MLEFNKDLLGLKVKGFKFIHSKLDYNPEMDSYIDETGIIKSYEKSYSLKYVVLRFKDGAEWAYPFVFIEDHLVEPIVLSEKQIKELFNSIYKL